MGWILLFLILIAAAFGVLGLVIKATVFVVLTIVMTHARPGLHRVRDGAATGEEDDQGDGPSAPADAAADPGLPLLTVRDLTREREHLFALVGGQRRQ